jgi:predicted short-subunit dehydrogenase-like oxidoreductase (DUF2520 family)
MRKPSIAIVGAGNVARVLVVCLHRAGYRVTEIASRDPRRAAKIARTVGVRPVAYDAAQLDADLIWLCVTDGAIADVAKQFAKRRSWQGKTVFHSSGASPSSLLGPLQRKGAAIASVHPMNTFVPTTKLDLRGVPFAIEGEAAAVRTGERIANDLSRGGYVFRIRPEHKVLYHAMGSFASPLLVSLMEIAERVGSAGGLKQPERVLQRILLSTIHNLVAHGPAAAFSGPINRGDIATVRKHLTALAKVPDAKAVYRALAKNAVQQLPVKNRAALKKLLS